MEKKMPAFKHRLFNSIVELTNKIDAMQSQFDTYFKSEDGDDEPDLIQQVYTNKKNITTNKEAIAANTQADEAHISEYTEHKKNSLGFDVLDVVDCNAEETSLSTLDLSTEDIDDK